MYGYTMHVPAPLEAYQATHQAGPLDGVARRRRNSCVHR